MVKWAAVADRTGKEQFGVKGTSILGQHIQFPECVPSDYMHSILEGIFKHLMKFWFDTKYHDQPCSLRKFISRIDEALSKIKPPIEINRLPRPISSSLPILSKFLPCEHTHHLSLLVTSMHILLSDKIKKEDLDVAHSMLMCFHDFAGDSSNMHSVIHMVPLFPPPK